MSWLASLFIAALTAAAGLLVAGSIASLAVEWYRISSFEGGAGYFVVAIALLGLLVGLVFGLVAARWVAASARPGFGKGLGCALLTVLVPGLLAGGITRLLADVPPTLDGETLMLLVEMRWPASQKASPANDPVSRVLELGALSGSSLRTRKQGPFWMEDARLENGQWIVPGAVEVFTNRGRRVIQVEPRVPGALGLLLPMGSPGRQHLSWSDWLPRAGSDGAAAAGGFSYRYKVIPRSAASRTETVGPFEVDTIAGYFYVGDSQVGRSVMAAKAEFALRYRGQPVAVEVGPEPDAAVVSHAAGQPASASAQRFAGIATLPGLPTALLVIAAAGDGRSACMLLVDEGARLRSRRVAHCDEFFTAEVLTNDQDRREAAKSIHVVQGRIDRETFMQPGAYLFVDAIFDSGRRTARQVGRLDPPQGFNRSVSPLGISPDGLSIVRLGFSEKQQGGPALLVFDTASHTTYLVEIDQQATRYAGAHGVDITWLNHYYAWQRIDGGQDRLVARNGVQPLPYRGVVKTESGSDLVYQVQPSGKAMADALAEFLRTDFRALRTSKKVGTYGYESWIGTVKVNVFVNENEHQVAVFLDHGTDMALIPRIARGFDAVLATGRHDRLFGE